MSSLAGPTAPRRLLQTHGAFINATLVPRLKNRREWMASGKKIAIPGNAPDAVKINRAMNSVSQDECFDAREGEIMMYSKELSGFPSHRRAVVFSAINGHKVSSTTATAADADPRNVLYNSDWKFVGLCQNGFVSSNTALQDQGMALQTSGIKTVVNVSEETINIGDRLMVDTMQKLPSVGRKGIPPNKVTLCLRKVPDSFIPRTAIQKVEARAEKDPAYAQVTSTLQGSAAQKKTTEKALKALVKEIAALTVLEMRKVAKFVVGTAQSAARKNDQVDVLLTKPSFL